MSPSTPPAYAQASFPSPPTSSGITDDDRHAIIINIPTSQPVSAYHTKGWLTWLPLRHVSHEHSPLSPEAEYEREQRWQVIRRVIYFTLAATVLVGSCTGVGLSISSLRRSTTVIREPSPRTLEDFLHLGEDMEVKKENDNSDSSASVDVYLTAIFLLASVASFIFTLLAGGRLALAVHYRNLSKQDKAKDEGHFWIRMACIFGTRSMHTKKPQLPTYGHAVRQAVLKSGSRQGDPQAEFHNISAEEMELERIRKLGGAPPSYYQDKTEI